MLCTKCANDIPENTPLCPHCGASAPTQSIPRPGQKARVAENGIIHGTDGKYRWIYEVNQWSDPGALVRSVLKFSAMGLGFGLLFLLLPLVSGTFQSVTQNLPLLLTLTAAGALAGLIIHLSRILILGKCYCILFTMDANVIRSQQVDGRCTKQKAVRVISEWVGGQSYPELQFKQPVVSDFSRVGRVRSIPKRNTILVCCSANVHPIYVEPQQLDFVLEHLKTHCPDAKIKT